MQPRRPLATADEIPLCRFSRMGTRKGLSALDSSTRQEQPAGVDETFQQQLLEALAEGVVGLDAQGFFTFLNPAALRLLGYDSEAQALGRHGHAENHYPYPDGTPYPAEACPLYRILQTGQPLEAWEDHFWRTDGTCFPVRVHASPLRAPDGAITGLVVSFVDITTQKEAERALARNEQRYRLAQEATRFGIWEWNIPSDCVYWDTDTWHLLGYSAPAGAAPMSYTSFRACIHPEDLDAVENAIYHNLLLSRKERYAVAMRLRRADGGWQWVQARGRVVVRDDDGLPRWVMGTHMDISEIKRAQQRPRPHEERYRRFLDDFIGIAYQTQFHAPAPFLLRGMVKEVTGYDQAQFIAGRISWEDLIHPEDNDLLHHGLEQLQEEGQRFDREYRIIRQDGEIRWVRDIGRLVRLPDEDDWVLQGAMYDITEQKEAQRVRETFLAAVSHDLRTPLNTLAGFTQLLANTRLTTEQQRYLHYCRKASEQLRGLVDTLLELSQLRAGRLRLRPRPFCLTTFLHDHIDPLACQAQEKGLTFQWHTRQLPDRVHGDPVRLGQILLNLISNAIKFTEAGSMSLSPTVAQDSPKPRAKTSSRPSPATRRLKPYTPALG